MILKTTALLLALAPTLGFAAGKTVTRELLLQNSPVPEKREFPLSPTVGACEDFHKYVCGEAEAAFQLPANRSSWTLSLNDNAERLLQAKKNYFRLLGQGYEPRTKRAAQLKNYYLGCMDPAAHRAEEISNLAEQKARILGAKTREDIQKLVAEGFRKPSFGMVDYGGSPNQADPAWNDVIIEVNALTLPERTYYDDAAATADLEKLATAFFEAAGLDNAADRARQVVDFEKGLAKVTPAPEEMRRRQTENNYKERADITKGYPHVPFAQLYPLLPNRTKIRDWSPETLKYVDDALANAPIEQLQNVFLFNELYSTIDDSNPTYRQVLTGFSQRQLGGPKERPDREERCVSSVMSAFGMELDAELLPILFPNFPTQKVEKLAERVRSSIINGLQKNTWLSESAKAEAVKKITKADLMLVQPKRDEDWHFLPVKQYDAKKPLTNGKLVRQAKIDRELEELKKERNVHEWGMSPLTVNAYYSPPNNQFVLPMGILQFPVFDDKMGDVENLGAIGVVVGHELGHGIDDSGSKYDWQGKLRNWKTEADIREFDGRTQKFIDLYTKLGHNGQLTLGENIGDHEGVTFSSAAAFPDASKAKPQDVRNFFLAYGRLWCTVARPEYEKMQLKTNPHSLGWARINGQVIQSDLFQTAFGCQPGDKMYVAPADRIRVW